MLNFTTFGAASVMKIKIFFILSWFFFVICEEAPQIMKRDYQNFVKQKHVIPRWRAYNL